MEAERLGLGDAAFDLIVLSLLLSVVERPREALRVLQAGGLVLIFDKFAPDGAERIPWLRALLNRLATALGTDITRRLDDLLNGLPVDVVRVDPSLLGGYYRAVLLRARCASEAPS